MYNNIIHMHTQREQTVLSTDKVVENHMIKVTAVFEYRARWRFIQPFTVCTVI